MSELANELAGPSGSPVSFLDDRGFLVFWPEGYERPIALPVITHGSRDEAQAWTWNGSTEKPTLKPSVLTRHANGTTSHIWLTEGACQHLSDSTDGLAGQTLPLQQMPCHIGGGEWDHDWKEETDSAGEVDGGPGYWWTTRTCRKCGATDE